MILKVIVLALIGTLVAGLLKQVKPEISIVAVIVTGLIIIWTILGEIVTIKTTFSKLFESSNVEGIFSAVMKIVGIGYLTEYASSVCEDYGTSSLAKKVQLAGKVCIFAMSTSAVTTIMSAITKLV
ncbi:MAG: stage III sporulation AC/AD family protein [Christensenellaceae bacterium]|jgi:stage III sporulation protein AD|nr:stage III sporulation AC/AD family protein [Christensenellaceae bacterium]